MFFKLARAIHVHQDITAANKLAFHKNLRNCRPIANSKKHYQKLHELQSKHKEYLYFFTVSRRSGADSTSTAEMFKGKFDKIWAAALLNPHYRNKRHDDRHVMQLNMDLPEVPQAFPS